MEFDNVINEECAEGNENAATGGLNPHTCSTDPTEDQDNGGGDDERCADPAFREANPDLCRNFPVLILKPEYALKESGQTVQFKTYLRASGNEQELSNGLAYSVVDPGVAVIHATSGLATAVAPGITTVSVTWQNLEAFAQFETVASCAAVNVNYLLLIDNSESSKVAFGSGYATRLTYAKEAAREFAESVNYDRDKVSVGYFNTNGTITVEATDDKQTALDAITAIISTSNKTNIADGLQDGFTHLDTLTGYKALILFSDGENKEGSDPKVVANAWKEANKTIMVVALRAWGVHFDLLYRIASEGFFLSAYPATADAVITTLTQLKSYFCSSDCHNEPGTYPLAALNYRGFVNWDVFQGYVDLVGLGLWDVLPGNGLYVDLAGTALVDGVEVGTQAPGGIVSKEVFALVAGQDYKFSIDVAGNNVNKPNEDEPVKVTIYHDDDGTIELEETITPASFDDPFDTHEFEFTASQSGDVRIKIEMLEDADVPLAVTNNVGPLIDNVILENLTTATVILSDDFDDENPTTIPPEGSYYSGCIESPPGAQQADPTPPSAVTET